MLPVVVDFGRWPAVGSTVTVATVLDDPQRPSASPWPALPDHAVGRRECRKCHRAVVKGDLRDGLGPRCWRNVNAQPRRSGGLGRTPRPRPDHDGPDLIDLLTQPTEGRMTDALVEIDAILAPIKAANPGISNAEVVHYLPDRLRGPFWERAIGRYLDAELAKLDAEEGA